MKKKFLMTVFASSFAVATFAIDDECATPLNDEQLADHWVASEAVAVDKDEAIDKAI